MWLTTLFRFVSIQEHLIYYVESIPICQNRPPLLADLKIPEEEESVTLSDVLMQVQGGSIVIKAAVPIIEEEEEAVAILVVVAARPCPRGQERRSINFLLMHRKYTVRLTRMQSNNIQIPLKDEGVSNKAKNRSLTRSRGQL
jgi:hypothetical protein